MNSGDRTELKDYNNQEFPPVGIEHMNADEMQQAFLFLAHCPPLHLLLSTNHLVKALETVLEKLNETLGASLNKTKVSSLLNSRFNQFLEGMRHHKKKWRRNCGAIIYIFFTQC